VSGRVVELLGPSTGGIRVHVGALAEGLRRRGWAVVAAGPQGVLDGIDDRARQVDVPDGWNPMAFRRASAQLRRIVAETQPDIVHAHGLKAALVARSSGRPMVLTIHNLVAGGRALGARRLVADAMARLERYAIRGADQVIVISDEIDDHVAGIVPDERRAFMLPVAPRRSVTRDRATMRREWHDSFGVDPSAPVVVVVARLHPQKDLPTFLDAMRDVHSTRPDVRAVIAGDGPERAALDARRNELGLDGVVHFAGHRAAPIDDMAAADVVALSSRWEGSPLVVAEAMSVSAPLVTTAVGTVTRHFRDREHARIVPIGDSAALAVAIVETLDDPRRHEMGERGQRRAAEVFDPDRLVDAVADVYRRAVR
jgi:glycosyltransferase involved in cell wall biosynthesis